MKTAIFTASFNRPDLMQELLGGLANNIDDLEGIDVHHYVDGGPSAKQNEIESIIKESSIPYTSIVLREENYGVGRNLIGARRDLFDVHGYERVILIEDDLIPGPNFIKTTLSLADWAREYDDIGMVQVWNLPQESVSEDDIDVVVPTHEHFYTYCIDVEVWNEIKDTLYEYERRYLQGVSYAKKDWRSIRKRFMKPRYSKLRTIRRGKALLDAEHPHPPPFGPRLKRTVPTGQDAITALALWQKGFVRLATLAPRAVMKGVDGVHSTAKVFEQLGLNAQANHEWNQPVPTSFRLP
ncbi:MAG: hypothetical protein CL959_04245 [Euryarchaeota archaeon]|nr:hypothetical protein [Euryarchaeota archaeon]